MSKKGARPRRIGIEAYLWGEPGTYRQSGVSRYIRSLVRGLAAVTDLGQMLIYLPSAQALADVPRAAQLIGKPAGIPLRRPSQRLLWEHTIFPFLLYRDRVDVLHAAMSVAPWWTPCPIVVTILDLAYMRYPEVHPRARRLYLTAGTRQTVRRARALLAISEYTRQEIIDLLHVPGERIFVTPLGVDADFRPLPPGQVETFRRQHGLPERYILYLGNLEPRKNLPRLVQAYARLGHTSVPLVLAGARGWGYAELFKAVESLGLAERVLFPGFIPREDLPLWYNGATALVYPSFYEGFGLPPLEAMACGTPVMAAQASSLPEVVGDAGLLVPPLDIEGMADGLNRLLEDAELRATLRQRGLERIRHFTWDRTAQETARLYRQLLTR